jgi:O-acetyl-ADP-ribose deacetylase (regulator of RNase III)
MKEIKGDLFEMIYEDGVDAICITTNGMWLTDGRAAMGGGCAGVCAKRWPETAVRLGKCLKNFLTNVPFVIGALDENGEYIEPNLKMIKERKFKTLIISYPTIDDLMSGAKIDLIKNSAKEVKVLADRFGLKSIVVPRPGVGIGGLTWGDVKSEIEEYMDDRFTVISFEHEE